MDALGFERIEQLNDADEKLCERLGFRVIIYGADIPKAALRRLSDGSVRDATPEEVRLYSLLVELQMELDNDS